MISQNGKGSLQFHAFLQTRYLSSHELILNNVQFFNSKYLSKFLPCRARLKSKPVYSISAAPLILTISSICALCLVEPWYFLCWSLVYVIHRMGLTLTKDNITFFYFKCCHKLNIKIWVSTVEPETFKTFVEFFTYQVWSKNIVVFPKCFTEFAEFSDKNICHYSKRARICHITASCVRDQDVTTAPARHMLRQDL